MSTNFYEQAYRVIQCIPAGKVTSYGRVARMLGRPGASRAVGYALNSLRRHDRDNPYTSDTVPWHRVINSQGKISRRQHGSAAEEQAAKLRAEGVAVSNNMHVDMHVYLWETADQEIDMALHESLSHIAAAIESEHPQIAAILLFSLPPEDAGTVVHELSTGLAIELAERIYNTENVPSEVVDKLIAGFETLRLDAGRLKLNKNTLLLDALSHSGYLKQREIIRELADSFSINLEYDDIRMIEDLQKIDDVRLAEVLSLVEQNDLTLALRIADDEIQEKIFRCIEEETAEEIRSDLDWAGVVLLDDVAGASERVIFLFNTTPG